MVLNRECIKDILSFIDDNEEAGKVSVFNPDAPPMSDYSREEFVYHFNQCDTVGYFIKVDYLPMGAARVKALTPKARELLESWRAEGVV